MNEEISINKLINTEKTGLIFIEFKLKNPDDWNSLASLKKSYVYFLILL